jgi:hypothetical protein
MPTWSTTYTYSTTAPNSNVAVSGGTWSTPITEAQLGANGTSIRGDTGNSAVRYFIIVDIGTTPTAATSSTTATPAPNSGVFNWTTSSAGTVAVGKAQWQVDGIYTVSTGTYAWGQPYLSVFKVDTLSAFTTNTGALNVTGDITMGTSGKAIKSGTAVTFGSAGYYMGLDATGKALLSVMADANNGLKYDGSANTISLLGKIITSGNLAADSVLNAAIKTGEVSTTSIATNAITEVNTFTGGYVTLSSVVLAGANGVAADKVLMTATQLKTLIPKVNSIVKRLMIITLRLRTDDISPGFFNLALYNGSRDMDVFTVDLLVKNVSGTYADLTYTFQCSFETAVDTTSTYTTWDASNTIATQNGMPDIRIALINGAASGNYWSNPGTKGLLQAAVTVSIFTGKR